MQKNKQYDYSGPVMRDDICIERCWKTSTWAPSEKKARNNLIYRYRMDNDIPMACKVELDGDLVLKEGDADGGI